MSEIENTLTVTGEDGQKVTTPLDLELADELAAGMARDWIDAWDVAVYVRESDENAPKMLLVGQVWRVQEKDPREAVSLVMREFPKFDHVLLGTTLSIQVAPAGDHWYEDD